MSTEREVWVTVPTVAEFLAKRPSWIYQNIGAIPHRRIGQQLRFRLSEVEAWMQSQSGDRS